MAKYLSGREPYFRVGIDSTTDDLTSFSVIGNSYFTGIVTALTFSGDGSQLTGIVASGVGVDIRDDNITVGVITTFNFGQGIDVTSVSSGISTIFTSYSPLAGIATYAINAGVSTYANSSGIASYATVSGIATYAPVAGVATYAPIAGVATYAPVAGVATYAPVAGVATYAPVAGVSTISGYASLSGIATNVIGGIASVTNLNVSGVATLSQLTVGVITASTFSGNGSQLTNVIGLSTQWITNSVGLHTFSKVGIGTTAPLYNLHVNGEVVVSAGNSVAQHIKIKAYEEDGGALSFEGSSGQLLSVSNNLQGTIFGVNNISGIPIVEVDSNGTISLAESGGNVGLGSTRPTSKLYVVGDGYFTGVVTATTFYGDGSNLTGLSAGISSVSEYAKIAGIATYAEIAGIATYASVSGISSYTEVSGISTLALGFSTTASINTTGIITASIFVGNLIGTATTANTSEYSEVSGISTYSNNSGVSTYSNISGVSTYSNTSGVSTYANSSGVSTSTIGGIVNVSNLNVSGISTLDTVSVNQLFSSGIVTAFKFVGDGSLLTGVIPASSSGISISNNDTNVGVALTINFGRYLNVSPASAGIVTVTTPSSIPTGISKNSTPFVATEGQTSFVANYVVGSIEVFLNGIRLSESEYIADNGEVILLNEGASENDLLEIVNSQILFIPFGDYGDLGQVETDAFGIPISPSFDALTDPPATVAVNDLGQLV